MKDKILFFLISFFVMAACKSREVPVFILEKDIEKVAAQEILLGSTEIQLPVNKTSIEKLSFKDFYFVCNDGGPDAGFLHYYDSASTGNAFSAKVFKRAGEYPAPLYAVYFFNRKNNLVTHIVYEWQPLWVHFKDQLNIDSALRVPYPYADSAFYWKKFKVLFKYLNNKFESYIDYKLINFDPLHSLELLYIVDGETATGIHWFSEEHKIGLSISHRTGKRSQLKENAPKHSLAVYFIRNLE